MRRRREGRLGDDGLGVDGLGVRTGTVVGWEVEGVGGVGW